jgi:copper(I)-binding protein
LFNAVNVAKGWDMKLKIASTVLALGLAIGACKGGEKTSTTATIEQDGVKAVVEISDPWCRPSPNGAQAGACYLTVKSNVANRMTGVATPLAAHGMIHDMSMQDGVMNMAEIEGGLVLAANEEVKLAPGGKHVMLMGLTAPLVEGTAVPLTLTFEATPAMTVQAAVRQPKS